MYLPFDSPEQVVNTLKTSGLGSSWLLCVADQHSDAILPFLDICKQQQLFVAGGLFPGLLIGKEGRKDGVLAIPLPAGSQCCVASLSLAGISWKTPLDGKNTLFQSSFLLVDCLSSNIDQLLDEIYDHFGSRFNHVGCGTGFSDLRPQSSIFTIEGWHVHAALLILMPRLLTASVRHGWTRVAGPFVASRTSGHAIQELNWESAGSFYRALVETQNPELENKPIFPDINSTYPLCIAKEGSEDVIRDPISISSGDEIVLISHVTENSMMYLSHGDKESLIQAARQAVLDCVSAVSVEQCFVADCYSRALMLGPNLSHELDAVAEVLEQITTVPLEGVMAIGEIATNGKHRLDFFNKTFVIGLLHRAS